MAEKQVRIKLAVDGTGEAVSSLSKVDGGIKGVGKTAKESGGLVSTFGSQVKGSFGLAAMAAGAVTAGLMGAVKSAMEAERAAYRLSAATGRASAELTAFAEQRQRLTVYEDDATVAAMARIAMTVQDTESIKALTVAAQNLATATGKDLQTSAVALSKAMGGSSSSLLRMGISLDTTGMSAVELSEKINELTNNAADLEAQTAGGRMTQATNTWGNAWEKVGASLLPLAPSIEVVAEAIGGLTDILRAGWYAVEVFTDGIGAIFDWSLDEPLDAYNKMIGVFVEKTDGATGAQKNLGGAVDETADAMTDINGIIANYVEQVEKQEMTDAAILAMQKDPLMQGIVARLGLQTQAQKDAAAATEKEEEARRKLADALKREKEARAEAQAQRMLDAMIAAKEASMNIAAPEGFDPEKSPPLPDDFNVVVDDGTAAMEKFNSELSKSAELSIEDMLAKQAYREAVVSQTSVMLGSFSALAGQMKGGALASKRLAQASATIDMFAGANKAFAQGGVFGFITGAAIIAAGMANIAQIEAQQFADGGFVRGHGGRRSDMVPANLSAGEGILTASTVARIGGEAAINALNAGGGAGGGVVINFTGPVTDRAFVRDYIVPEVRRAVGRGMA